MASANDAMIFVAFGCLLVLQCFHIAAMIVVLMLHFSTIENVSQYHKHPFPLRISRPDRKYSIINKIITKQKKSHTVWFNWIANNKIIIIFNRKSPNYCQNRKNISTLMFVSIILLFEAEERARPADTPTPFAVSRGRSGDDSCEWNGGMCEENYVVWTGRPLLRATVEHSHHNRDVHPLS